MNNQLQEKKLNPVSQMTTFLSSNAVKNKVTKTPLGLFNTNIIIGDSDIPTTEPNETYFVTAKVPIKSATPTGTICIKVAIIEPNVQAIPFPPLNFK